eukprot:scaffold481_cov238-Pinguiococcus_pyrenoidosus.AAC.1
MLLQNALDALQSRGCEARNTGRHSAGICTSSAGRGGTKDATPLIRDPAPSRERTADEAPPLTPGKHDHPLKRPHFGCVAQPASKRSTKRRRDRPPRC